MANPNKTVARARRAMGGFPTREPNEARKAQSAEFSMFMDWCVKQYEAGRTFASVEEAREVYTKEVALTREM